jgi:hypothetical protein
LPRWQSIVAEGSTASGVEAELPGFLGNEEKPNGAALRTDKWNRHFEREAESERFLSRNPVPSGHMNQCFTHRSPSHLKLLSDPWPEDFSEARAKIERQKEAATLPALKNSRRKTRVTPSSS